MPSEITSPVVDRTRNRIRGSYSLRNTARNPQITLYWGTTEALAFADRWENRITLKLPREGKNDFVIENVPSDKPIFVRLLLQNSEGQFWTPATMKVEPDHR